MPFCQKKCSYCDFTSFTDLSQVPEWLAGVAQEVQFYAELPLTCDTIYLGGGTPSLLTIPQLEFLLDLCQQNFIVLPGSEITLEANPDDLTLNKLQQYRLLSLNRLSLGVQSLRDRELAFLGRRHDAAQARRAFEWAREAGFANVGVDLIYGLPEQSLADWRQTLTEITAWQPEHLSCYQLTWEEGTPLGRAKAAGDFQRPSEEEERRFFLFTVDFLARRGYIQYEVANFARGATYFCRHNAKYWSRRPYIGLGPAAHSFLDGRRFWNQRSLTAYCEALQAGKRPVAGEEVLTKAQEHLEALWLGLRTTTGVNLSLLAEVEINQRALQELVAEGLVEIRGDCLRPTPLGLVVADRLALALLE